MAMNVNRSGKGIYSRRKYVTPSIRTLFLGEIYFRAKKKVGTWAKYDTYPGTRGQGILFQPFQVNIYVSLKKKPQ